MEETKLVEGRLDTSIKKVRNIFWGIGIIAGGIMGAYTIITLLDYLDYVQDYYWKNWMTSTMVSSIIITIVFFLIPFITGCILYSGLSKIQIVVTNRRVYGKTAFGKQVDLPLDSISALGMGMLSSIAVATSSGKITFWGIGNRDEIHRVISQLLADRQYEKKREMPVTNIKQEVAQSSADELKKFKDLFDSGVISKEEFDAKKKQLLGL